MSYIKDRRVKDRRSLRISMIQDICIYTERFELQTKMARVTRQEPRVKDSSIDKHPGLPIS